MRFLILVKHAMPAIDPTITAAHWPLSDAGRRASRALAERLADYTPTCVVTSREPKAHETGQIVADRLGLVCEAVEGLHEHDRSTVPFSDTATFQADVARFFAHPDRLVHGRETADAAGARFATAVQTVLDRYRQGNLVVVTHGTVLTLFVARHNAIDPFPFWQRLGLPSVVVLSMPDFKVIEVVERIHDKGGPHLFPLTP